MHKRIREISAKTGGQLHKEEGINESRQSQLSIRIKAPNRTRILNDFVA